MGGSGRRRSRRTLVSRFRTRPTAKLCRPREATGTYAAAPLRLGGRTPKPRGLRVSCTPRSAKRPLLVARPHPCTKPAEEFRTAVRQLSHRDYPPYVACDIICQQDPPLCLYRHAVADAVAAHGFDDAWLEAEHADKSGEGRANTFEVCQDAGYQLIEFPEVDVPDELRDPIAVAARRTCLCFAQQMVATDPMIAPQTARRRIAEIITEAVHDSSSG